jgi:hypothetical protein
VLDFWLHAFLIILGIKGIVDVSDEFNAVSIKLILRTDQSGVWSRISPVSQCYLFLLHSALLYLNEIN